MKPEKLQTLYSLCRSYSIEKKGRLRDDSREVQKGDIFIALKKKGHQYIQQAVDQGAQVIIADEKSFIPSSFKGSVHIVDSTEEILSSLLNQFYNWPSEKMFCVGITGTNGKTTTSLMIEKIFTEGGWKTGVIGTLGSHIESQTWSSQLTTPRAVELYERLNDFYQNEARATVMEVSSIGLDQKRVKGVHFNVLVFTNFTQDHLDYHGSMESYFQAKVSLFNQAKNQTSNHCVCVMNADEDPIYNYMKKNSLPTFSYGKTGHDMRYEILKESLEGIDFRLFYKEKKWEVHLPLIGVHNVSNALAALATSVVGGFSVERSLKSLESFQGVKGRLQKVCSSPFFVFVDYAHTDQALDNTLQALKKSSLKNSRLITVFGCGGERDKDKRKKMAQVASKYSQFVVVTSDNPRNEDPQSIIQDIVQGLTLPSSCVFEIEDRRLGIQQGLKLAQKGDILLIAGKGHESHQIVGSKYIPFDDVQVCQELLMEIS